MVIRTLFDQRKERGQGLVESTPIIPLFLMLSMGIVALVRLMAF